MLKNNNSREDCDGGQADHNSDFTAVMGLFNLSQNPAFQLPTSPPNMDNDEDMVLPTFDGSLELYFDSPTQPHSILSSQDVPDVFKNGTPFMDLLFAQRIPPTQSPNSQKQLVEIAKEGELISDEDSEYGDDPRFQFTRQMVNRAGELGSQCAMAMKKLDRLMDDVEKL
ncbi:unnamed protein product [Calypogeia fissa]